MDASRPPTVEQDPAVIDRVSRYTPILMCDREEPFGLVTVGFTVFDGPEESPSFPRRIDWKAQGFLAEQAIEYALWWDWDIQHLYELEHVWVYLDSVGKPVAAEASWHGYFLPLGVGDGLILEGDHPVAFVQAGKHAMVARPDGFELMREDALAAAGERAGEDGVLDSPMFPNALGKSPEADARVRRYLRQHSFVPSFQFDRRMDISHDQLVPWPVLGEWIPARVHWWLEQLGPIE